MIDKQEYYHGAAIIRLLDDSRCQNIHKHEFGYIINNLTFVVLKYSTKARSPWRFTFSHDDVNRLSDCRAQYEKIVIVLICGGDGICAILDAEFSNIMQQEAGWISAYRAFKEQYNVAGPHGELMRKVSFKRWPSIVFEPVEQIKCKRGR